MDFDNYFTQAKNVNNMKIKVYDEIMSSLRGYHDFKAVEINDSVIHLIFHEFISKKRIHELERLLNLTWISVSDINGEISVSFTTERLINEMRESEQYMSEEY